MKQYCRYCAFCICIRGDYPYYCTVKNAEITKARVMSVNKCDLFALSEAGDVDTGKQYRPRIREKKTPVINYVPLFKEE